MHPGDEVTVKNAFLITVNKVSVLWCSVRSQIFVVEKRIRTKKRCRQASTVIPFGLLHSLTKDLFLNLSNIDFDIRALDKKSYDSFMRTMLSWKFKNHSKQTHPLLSFLQVDESSVSLSQEEQFEFAQFKSVDQLSEIVRSMALHDKRRWTQGLFFINVLSVLHQQWALT